MREMQYERIFQIETETMVVQINHLGGILWLRAQFVHNDDT